MIKALGPATVRGLIQTQTPMTPDEKRAAMLEASDREFKARCVRLGLSPEQVDEAFEQRDCFFEWLENRRQEVV